MATQSVTQSQVRIGWRPYVTTQVVNIIDADATTFITAAGITNLIQASAINTLVNDLKTYGLWTKMKAIYPFVGGSATSHKFNLKDPRDLDAAYRLVFNGGWTHSSTGALPNGTTGYANTFLIPNNNLLLNSVHLSYYSKTDNSISDMLMGSNDNNGYGGYYLLLSTGNFTNNDKILRSQLNTNGPDFIDGTMTNTQGFLLSNRTSSTSVALFKNASKLITGSKNSIGRSTISMYLGSRNYGGVASNFSNKESAFATIGDGLTDTEATNFYNSVQKFQTSLGRQIGTPVLAAGQIANLLETYYGSGAAYSTRRIRTTYTGPALRVRRSSDNTEQDINFNTNGDLDTTALISFTGTSNGFVTKWYDQSGNGRDMIQTTGANQPQISMNGIVFTEKGKPTITSTGACVMSMNGTIPVSTAISSFILLRTNIIKSNNNSGMFLGFIAGAHLSPSRNSLGTNRYYGTNDITYPSLSTGNNYITITNNSNKVDAWENGTQVVNNVNSASDSILASTGISLFDRWLNSGPLTLGTSLSEVIIYNSDQRTNRTSIESSMDSYFNLAYSDSDAQSFITAAGISNSVQQTALIRLVKMLKNEGLWTKMKAIYPFVGGTAVTHKWNLKDPRDTNDAFRLTFYGGLSHDGGGVYFNGSNSWCDTNMNAATNLNVDNLHLSFYSRTNANNTYSGGEIGHVGYNSWTTPPQDPLKQFTLRVRSAQYGGGAQFSSGNLSTGYSTIDGFGLTIGSITNSSTAKMYKGRNTQEFATKSTASTTNTGTLPSFNISIGKIQGYGEWSNQQSAFVSIGDGLTDAESAKLYGIVQIYQITLGRSV
jgi:hypothetical protein